jgi:DNA-binding NtrC family response regulator
MVIADTLRDAGFAILEAENAHEALEVLQTVPNIQLLCTDVQMPGGLDGVGLTLLVKARHPDVRVIICSGFSPWHASLAGVPFLAKPFLRSDLVELARREVSPELNGPSHRLVAPAT